MSEPKLSAKGIDFGGEIELVAVQFDRAINLTGDKRLLLGSTVNGASSGDRTIQGKVERIFQMRNGNIRALIRTTPAGPSDESKPKYLIYSPPYHADVKDPE